MDRHDDVGRQLIRRLLLLLPGSLEKQCSWPSVAVAAIVMGLVSWITLRLAKRVQRHRAPPPSKPRPIEPLHDFQWQDVEPRKLRPWKPVYHITMALTSSAPSDLIIVDRNYLDRVNLRRTLIDRHGSTVHGCLPGGGVDAVRDVYAYLLGEYLPARYPTMFELSDNGRTFRNLVTGREFPSSMTDSSDDDTTTVEAAAAALRILGETVEDDMFLLRQTPDGHRTEAFVCCFPAGFDGSEKLGKLLADVHGPVPSYDKIGASMERFFSRLEVGKSVKRVNWSIQTDDVLFHCESHASQADDTGYEGKDAFPIENTHARMELQTLTRLPRTRSILFSFKTYLYPLGEIKAEGLGPDMADAIEGLDSGNAPGMGAYKGTGRWSGKVCEYLRS